MIQNVLKTRIEVPNVGHDSNLSTAVNSQSFGQRLREERERLGMSQVQLAEQGKVARTTQHIYEADIRVPDVTYLERLRGIGVDVAYLVLGVRQSHTNPDTLTISYAALLNVYRIVDEFCVDVDGKPLQLEVRVRLFQLLCASLKDQGRGDSNLESLRGELRRLTEA